MKFLLRTLLMLLILAVAVPGIAEAGRFKLINYYGQGMYIEYEFALPPIFGSPVKRFTGAKCLDPTQWEWVWDVQGSPTRAKVFKMVTKGLHMPYYCVQRDPHLVPEKMYVTEASFPPPTSPNHWGEEITITLDKRGNVTIRKN